MNEMTAQAGESPAQSSFCTFGLLVTGKGERDFLPDLFRSLMARAGCTFAVVRRIGQRHPITSPARRLKMVGSGQDIPTNDESEIGIPVRHFLRQPPCRFLVLIDDVETIRHPKNELKQSFPGFDERVHGAKIVARLELDHVLSNPQTCAFLRSLFGWCVQRLLDHCPVYDAGLGAYFNLQGGVREPLTADQ